MMDNYDNTKNLKKHHFDFGSNSQSLQAHKFDTITRKDSKFLDRFTTNKSTLGHLKDVMKEHGASHFKMGYTDTRPITAAIPMSMKQNNATPEKIKPSTTNPYAHFISSQNRAPQFLPKVNQMQR